MKINTASRFVTGVAYFTRAALLLWLLSFGTAQAQSTQFSYQGRLTDNSLPANGTYDFQFKLFDAASGGTQVGTTVSQTNINVSSGIFTVTLDFGAGSFPGANRFLEINVRLAGGGAFTPLNPRQPVTSTPYAIQSLNAANAANATNATTATNFSGVLAGDVTGTQAATALANNAVTTPKIADANVTDAKIASVSGGKVTGAVATATNATTATTAGNVTGIVAIANGGTGSATQNFVDLTTTQSVGGNKTFTGNVKVGSTLTVLANPSTTGLNNNFIGNEAGRFNTTGNQNTIVGDRNFSSNTTGIGNTGMGFFALNGNIAGNSNTGFGTNTLRFTTADNNTAVGRDALINNSTGANNIALGFNAGNQLTTGSNNIHIGNVGVAGESGIIRIGTAGNQTATFLTGVINGNGSGLTDLSAANIATGTLPIARGGTGITTNPAAAGQFLRSSAANTWAVSALQAADLPTGSGNYIQNGVALQASSNFNISGNGLIGGNVGIGTTNPAAKLDVNGILSVHDLGTHTLSGGIATELGAAIINFGLNDGRFGTQNQAKQGGFIRVDGRNESPLFQFFGRAAASADLVNLLNISATGDVGIGTTPIGGAKLRVQQLANVAGIEVTDGTVIVATEIVSPGAGRIGTTTNHDLRLKTNNGTKAVIDTSGNLFPFNDGGGSLGTASNRWSAVFAQNGTIQTSDARLKKSVKNLGYGLSQVMQLRPVSFEWKDRPDGRNYLGLIAQEVEKIIPEAIERDKDSANPLGMSYTSLVPVLIKAVQEQQSAMEQKEAAIKSLQTENASLQRHNAELDARLSALEQALQQLKQQAEKQPQPKQQ